MVTKFVIFFAFTIAAVAQPQFNVIRDASNNVLAVSTEALPATTGTVFVADVVAPIECLAPNPLFDEYGRCWWRLSGSAIVPGAPRWPATAALKRAAAKRLRGKLDETLRDILTLERWQLDPANVLVLDRSAELTAAQARFGQLRDILAGP